MTRVKMLFYDLETTGLSAFKHGIHELSFIYCERTENKLIEVDRKTFHMNPQKCVIESEALDVAKITEQQVKAYPPESEVFSLFRAYLQEKIDKFNKKDKAFLVGFNNRSFDDLFLRQLFVRNGDNYFGSMFWANTIDTMVLASEKLLESRASMEDFKLATVARALGITVIEENLHNGMYDVTLTKQIYEELFIRKQKLIGFVEEGSKEIVKTIPDNSKPFYPVTIPV